MAKNPKVGDAVLFRGESCTVTAINARGAIVEGEAVKVAIYTFESDTKKVKSAGPFEYVEEHSAWILPGMLLSKDEVEEWKGVTSSKQNPGAEDHVAARRLIMKMREA